MGSLRDLTSKRFGKLTVVRRGAGKSFGYVTHTTWICFCDCGKETEVVAQKLLSGRTASCGCLNLEVLTTHGHASLGKQSPEYVSWRGAKQRCTNPSLKSWPNYGGRGIRMAERWINDFRAFLADMGTAPTGTSLDRIDPDGHYEPGNCRWATVAEQHRTRRDNVMIEHDGERLCAADWAQRLGVSHTCIAQRLRRGKSVTGKQPV